MNELSIKPTNTTPNINYNTESGILEFSGKSLPTNSIEFYEPVFAWANEFFNSADVPTNFCLEFKIDYYNTSSSKQIAKFFRIIETSLAAPIVTVNWFYDEEDIDMLDAGERFNKLLEIDFKFSVNEE
jgi:hypothetical protein